MAVSALHAPMPLDRWLERIHPGDRELALAALGPEANTRLDLRIRVVSDTEEIIVVDMRGGVLAADADGTASDKAHETSMNEELVGLVWDVTAHARRNEDEARTQRRRVEEAEDRCMQKQELIDTVCHEIRNPLQGVVGAATLLRDDLKRTTEELHRLAAEKVTEGWYSSLLVTCGCSRDLCMSGLFRVPRYGVTLLRVACLAY